MGSEIFRPALLERIPKSVKRFSEKMRSRILARLPNRRVFTFKVICRPLVVIEPSILLSRIKTGQFHA
ncbi:MULTISPECIES: hypothetical protein [unclassified Brucella]|uniref:hypothetical protein n=1 Tax=unclassified Brucella TaxID=2632610 RepID=UPI0028773570|nr:MULTISPECIES: hypothetical protein [unclassified Brucella]